MKFLKHLLFLATGVLILGSCDDNEVEQVNGELSLSIIQKSINNGRIQLDETPSSISITIKKEGEIILENEKYSITQFGTGFLIDPIVLETGTYTIEDFLVFNSNDEVFFATPKVDSDFEQIVSTPLPTSFEIMADNVSELVLEVISTEGIDPEDLGYASISFDILPVENILVSVFTQSDGSHTFVESELTLFGDSDSIYTVSLGDSINVVKVRSDYESISLEFNASGYDSKTIQIAGSDLSNYTTVPLEVIFTTDEDVDLENGLIAYYQLDKDANDSGSNGLDGVLGDDAGNNEPDATADRNGMANAAFEFDGTEKYVDLTENTLFDLGDYAEFSISTWIDPLEDYTSERGETIVSKYISASDNRMYVLRILDENISFRIFEEGTISAFDEVSSPFLEGWQHVAVVLENDVLTLYINGVSKSSVAKTVNIKDDSPTAKTLIGAIHFSESLFDRNFEGKIDEVRFYNRALNFPEVSALANE